MATRRQGPLSVSATSAALALLLVAYLALATYFNFTYPAWEGGDEPQHFEQIRTLVRDGHFPRPVSWVTTPLADRNMSHQGPLYYALEAALVGWTMPTDAGRVWRANPYVTWPEHKSALALAVHTPEEQPPYSPAVWALHAARFGSTLLGLLMVISAYLIAKEVIGSRGGLVAAGLVAFTPAVVYLSATVNNEIAAAAFAGLALAFSVRLAARGGDAPRAGILVGVFVAFAGLAKLDGLFVLPVAALAGLLAPRLELRSSSKGEDGGRHWRAHLAYLALVVGLPAVAMGVWYWAVRANWDLIVLNSELAGAGSNGGLTWLLTPFNPAAYERLSWALPRLFASYWGVLGAVSGACFMPAWVYNALGLLAAAGMLGLVAFALRPSGWRKMPAARRRALALAALAALLLTYTVIARTGQARTAEALDGRHLLSITGALAALLLLGLASGVPRRGRAAGGTALLVGLFALSVYMPGLYTETVHLPYLDVVNGGAATKPMARFANGLALLNWSAPLEDLRPGASLPLTLRWQVERPFPEDFEVAVLVVASDGNAYLAAQTMPARDVLPPAGWLPGDVITDHPELIVPPYVPLGRGRLEVHVVRESDGKPILRADGAVNPLADLGEVDVGPPLVTESTIGLETDVRYGDSLSLVGVDLNEQATAGQPLRPTLFWRGLAKLPEDYVVSLQLMDGQGKLAAQADNPPLDGHYPTSQWVAGEIVADPRTLPLPADLPPGTYELRAIVYKYPSLERLPVSGAQGAGDYAVLGKVTVR